MTISSEENQFDFLSEESAPADVADTSEASTEQEEEKAPETVEPETEKKAEPANEFDYSDSIEKMEEDASLSDEDSESEAEDGEKDSTDDSEKPAEKDTGEQKSEPTQAQMFQAAQLGLDQADVDGLNSRELATAIRIAEKMKPAEKPAEGEEKKEEALFTPIALDGLDEFDDDTQSLVKGLQEQFNTNMQKMAEELKKSQDVLGQSQESTAQQNQAQFFEWFDGSVDKLGEDWNDVFGADPNKLERGTPEVQNRIKLMEEMDKLAISHPELGKQDLFDSAMRLSFSTEMNDKQEQSKKADRNKHRQNRTTMRPSQRNRSIENMPDGREKALAMVKDIGKKKKFFGLF